MNTLLNGLKNATNYTYTENGAITHKSTMSGLADLFAFGAAYRSRSDNDCILLFKNAYEEDPVYALKCLFYLRDVRGGQGERRFFRVCMNWLARQHGDAAVRNLKYVAEFGRWDDLFCFIGTPLQKYALEFIKNQLALDVESRTPSLLAKWLPSENASSKNTKFLGAIVRKYLGMTHKQYRKTLSILRERINVLERLMSAGKWDEIEFDKIPSRAGMIYKNAFARHDIERMKSEKQVQSYSDFAKDETKTVNAKTLYPYEVVSKAYNLTRNAWDRWGNSRYGYDERNIDPVDRAIVNKYWDNLENVFNGYSFNGLCVCDTSASMWRNDAAAPINVAISIALYCAERAGGPFAGHYISFSRHPQLIRTEGVDFVDKVFRIYSTNLCENTDIEATFDLILDTVLRNRCRQEDLPKNIIVISDMEFDRGRGVYNYYDHTATLMETIERKWNAHGYKMPNLVYWNVDARQNNIPMTMKHGITFVSGMSPTIFKMLMTGKTAMDLIYDTLDQERYACIK